ncbi:hypothetical protein G3I76_21965, partial [Streptomyces sp. SID11233]|nr:hypothetical protein [Streptomyces sp. SID11233]
MPGADDAVALPGAAGASEPYDGEPLQALVARLRGAGLDPDVEQLCDALWLASLTGAPEGPEGEGDGPGVTPPDGPIPGERAGAEGRERPGADGGRVAHTG